MTVRALLSVLVATVMTLAATSAFAQDAEPAYTPHRYSRAELINFGAYDTPPLKFNWTVEDVQQKPVANRLDFVLTVDANFGEVVDTLKKAYLANKEVAQLAPGVLPFQTKRALKVIGHTDVDNTDPARFTLGGKGMSRRFVVDISSKGTKTQITIENVMHGQLYSGLVPSRAPFKPSGAKPVHLLYN